MGAHRMYTPAALSARSLVGGLVPESTGVGFKPEHFARILESRPDVDFFEIHAENYMCAGGPRHRHLTALRERYALSVHGVGLSIGTDQALDGGHLARLRTLIARYQPSLFSEHLAWSSHRCGFLNDLLPVPYTEDALLRVTEHIDQVQEALSRQLLLENPSSYVAFAESVYSEPSFLNEVIERSGCALLLDVNNVYVSATNLGFDPFAYLDELLPESVRQIHLAGHARDTDEKGGSVLIDTHDRAVDPAVWALYAYAIERIGPVPTLIEWDTELPCWEALHLEAGRAAAVMTRREDARAPLEQV